LIFVVVADWPNYDEGNHSDSGSEVDSSLRSSSAAEQYSRVNAGHVSESTHSESAPSFEHTSLYPKLRNIPETASYTAQKIMHLLDEIGTSNLVERSLDSNRFLHCSHCIGRLISL
jgi:hypothetical protein